MQAIKADIQLAIAEIEVSSISAVVNDITSSLFVIETVKCSQGKRQTVLQSVLRLMP